MTLFLHILSYKFRSFLSATFDFRSVPLIRGIGSLLVFGGFAWGAYSLSFGITEYVLEETRTGLYLYHRFISMILFVFFMAVNLGNIIVSYSTLYKANDVIFFLTKPVPYLTVFIMKFLDNFFYSSATLFMVAFAVLAGYGAYFGYPWYFFLGVMVFVLIPFMFLAACLAVLILMGIMRIAGRIGFRTVMGGLFVLYFGFIIIFFRFSNPVRLIEQVNRFYPNVDAYLSRLEPGFLDYLPSHWVAEFLLSVAKGEVTGALLPALLLLGSVVLSFAFVLLVARRYYFNTWLTSLKIQAAGSAPYDPAKMNVVDFRRSGLLKGWAESLFKKEYLTFMREPSQVIHLIVMLVLTGLFALSISNLNLRVRVTDIQLVTYLVLYAFSGFLISSIALRFVYPSISLEGKAFWMLRSAPIPPRTILAFKYGLAFVIVFLLSLAVSVATNAPFSRFSGRQPMLPWFGVFNAFWTSIAVVAVNLGLGTYFMSFEEKNPIRIASTQGATLTFLVTLVFLFILLVVVIYPLSLYFESLFIFRPFDRWSIVAPGAIMGMISTAVAGVAFSIGLYALRRDL